MAEGMDTGDDSAEGEEVLREREGTERKRGKRKITIKMSTSKEDDVTTSKG